MVYSIQSGGNYGWSVQEGDAPVPARAQEGAAANSKPVVEHPHSEFRSITGGYVYRGERLPELKGAYIYGDYDTGRVWMLRTKAMRRTSRQSRPSTASWPTTQVRIVEFAQDAAGEVYLVDFAGGGLHRLARDAAASGDGAQFPRKLSETGLFASTKDIKPARGSSPIR